MTISFEHALYVVVGMLVAYPLLRRRADDFIQPMRERLGELGARLEHDPSLNQAQRDQVKRVLDKAYDWRYPILLCVLSPIAFAFVIINRKQMIHENPVLEEIHDEEAKQDFNEVMEMGFRSIVWANPLAGAVLMVEKLVLITVLMLLGRSTRAYRRVSQAAQAWSPAGLRHI